MKKQILLILLMLVGLNFAIVSLNRTGNVFNMTNSYRSYYINATTAIQYTNDYLNYWSTNAFCINTTMTGYRCQENVTGWVWTNSTNSTDIYLTAGLNISGSGGHWLNITLRYYLNDSADKIEITPTFKGDFTSAATQFIWRTHNIQIDRTKENDWIRVWNTTGLEDYRLNTTSNKTYLYSGLGQKSFELYDNITTNFTRTEWEQNFNLGVTKTSEYNAYVDIYQNVALSGTWTKTWNLWWVDALCSWTCTSTAPSGTVTIAQGDTFAMNGRHQTTGGTCNPAGQYNEAQFLNNTVPTWYTIPDSNANMTYGPFDSNPDSGSISSWTITGNNWASTYYSVRVHCYYNLANAYTHEQYVNITAPPTTISCTGLSANTTLSADTKACYNILTNYTTFDCNGKVMYGDNLVTAFNITKGINITIKNCNFANYTSVVNATDSVNLLFYNNTFSNTNASSTNGMKRDFGFYLIYRSNSTIIANSSMWNVTIYRASGWINTGGDLYVIRLSSSLNATVSNVSANDSSGNFHSGGGDPTIQQIGYIVETDGLVSNMTFSKIYGNNVTYGFYLDGSLISGAYSLTDSNTSVAYTGLYSNVSITVNKFNVSAGPNIGTMVSQVSSAGSNYSNINVIGSGQVTGIGFRTSSANTSLSNLSCFNTTYCINDAHASDIFTANNITSNYSYYCVYYSYAISKYGYINNIVCDYSNYSIYAQYQADGGFLVSNGTLVYRNILKSETVWLGSLVTNLTFLNVTANFTNYTYQVGHGDNNFTVKWYARVAVKDSGGSALVATVNVTNNQTGNEYYGYQSTTPYFIANDTRYGAVTNTTYNNHYIVVNLSGYTTNYTYFNISYRDPIINITLYLSSPPTSSCTYSGSGNWIIELPDKCNITSSQYIYPNNLTFNGTSGYVTFGTSTNALLIMTVKRFYWNGTGSVYMWFKNSTWFNGTMGS